MELRVKEDGSVGYSPRHEEVFEQVHPAQNEKLRELVVRSAFGRADPAFIRKKKVVELYAGNGNLTEVLAAGVERMWAVESNENAVAQGQLRTEGKSQSHVEWILGTAEWGLKTVYRKGIIPDVLVLDPPRSGAADVVDLILLSRPRRIVYVSCDPTTLARDLKELVKRYYVLESVTRVDMFPQTYHVECVAVLTVIPT